MVCAGCPAQALVKEAEKKREKVSQEIVYQSSGQQTLEQAVERARSEAHLTAAAAPLVELKNLILVGFDDCLGAIICPQLEEYSVQVGFNRARAAAHLLGNFAR